MKNKHSIADNTVSVFVTRRNGIEYTVLFDLEDWNGLKDYPIRVVNQKKSLYAMARNKDGIDCYLHRVVMNAPPGVVVDHRVGPGLDNRKSNLRFVTNAINIQNPQSLRTTNTSGYRGVSYDKLKNKWGAKAFKDGKNYHLGYFTNPEEASKVVETFWAKTAAADEITLQSL